MHWAGRRHTLNNSINTTAPNVTIYTIKELEQIVDPTDHKQGAMCYKLHNCQHQPLLLVLSQLFFSLLLVPELMGVSVPWAEQYVCMSTCVQMELLHMTAITHLLLPPTSILHMKVKIHRCIHLPQSFLQFNLYVHDQSRAPAFILRKLIIVQSSSPAPNKPRNVWCARLVHSLSCDYRAYLYIGYFHQL